MSKPEIKNKARTLQDFKSTHDKDTVIPARIRAALAEMAKMGPEHHEYETDFCAMVGALSNADLGKYRPLFEKHIVIVNHANGKKLSSPKNVWFHDAKLAAKLRGE